MGFKKIKNRIKNQIILNKSKHCKNVHIMFNDKFNKPLVDFFNKYFDAKDNLFVFYDGYSKDLFKIPKYSNVIELKDMANMKLHNNVKKVFLHGLFNSGTINWLYDNKDILHKCYWFIWGGDLYDIEENEKSMYIKKNVKAYLGSLAKDAEYAREKYNSNAVFLSIDIPSPLSLEMLEDAQKGKIKKDYTVIQINHSACQSTLEILDKLARFKDKPIKVKTVLSYADIVYNDEIIKKGKEIFQDKFIPQMDYLQPQDHAKYLADADILIMNQQRQQGGRNINAMLYFGCKVYLRSDVSTWHYYQEEQNFKLFDTLNLDNETFENFIEMSQEDRDSNKKLAYELHNDKNIISYWEKIFNYDL